MPNQNGKQKSNKLLKQILELFEEEKQKLTKIEHEEWNRDVAGEDLNCGDMICRKGNLFFKCRADKSIPIFPPYRIKTPKGRGNNITQKR